MNCPGHMLLFGSPLRSYRDLPIRYAESSTLHRDELAGTLHGLLRVRHITQDDAHIFCARGADPGRDPRLPRLRALPLRPVRARAPRRALDAAGQAARHRRGVGLRRGGARGGARSGAEIEYVVNEGEGAFYGPKIDLHMTDSLGRSWQMGTIQLDYQMPAAVRAHATWAPTTREHTPYVIHRALLGSLERFIGILTEHYARRLPVLARARPGAGAAGRRGARRGRRRGGGAGSARPASGPTWGRRRDDRQADPERRAGEDPLSSSSTATRSRTRAWPCGSTAAGRKRSDWWNSSPSLLPLRPEKQGRTRSSPPRAPRPRGVQPSRKRRGSGPLHAAAFASFADQQTGRQEE